MEWGAYAPDLRKFPVVWPLFFPHQSLEAPTAWPGPAFPPQAKVRLLVGQRDRSKILLVL